jgi:amino acid transporter
MIQRKQTLWLLLATVSLFLTFVFPFFNGTKYVREHTFPDRNFNGDTTIAVFLFTILTMGLCSAAIFLYKKRKLQFRLALAAMITAAANIYYYFAGIKIHFEKGHILLTRKISKVAGQAEMS